MTDRAPPKPVTTFPLRASGGRRGDGAGLVRGAGPGRGQARARPRRPVARDRDGAQPVSGRTKRGPTGRTPATRGRHPKPPKASDTQKADAEGESATTQEETLITKGEGEREREPRRAGASRAGALPALQGREARCASREATGASRTRSTCRQPQPAAHDPQAEAPQAREAAPSPLGVAESRGAPRRANPGAPTSTHAGSPERGWSAGATTGAKRPWPTSRPNDYEGLDQVARHPGRLIDASATPAHLSNCSGAGRGVGPGEGVGGSLGAPLSPKPVHFARPDAPFNQQNVGPRRPGIYPTNCCRTPAGGAP